MVEIAPGDSECKSGQAAIYIFNCVNIFYFILLFNKFQNDIKYVQDCHNSCAWE